MTTTTNPFFGKYTTPHATVPFDKIRLEHYEEAFVEGIRRDNELIDKIVSDPAVPSFENTIVLRDSDPDGYYDLLSRVSTVFFNMLSANTCDELDALAQKVQPMLTKHANDVRLNSRLFERIRQVWLRHEPLRPEEKKLLDETYEGLVRGGAKLPDEDKEKLRRMTEEASMLSLQFSQNLLKAEKAYQLHITNPLALDGLPDSSREAAAAAAKEAGLDGWLFTLDQPSYGPFMQYNRNRLLRQQMYMAKSTLCSGGAEDNREICRRLVNLRQGIAQLLGFPTYADYVLQKRMAGTTKNVYRLLDQLTVAYRPKAEKELTAITRMLHRDTPRSTRLAPWDFSYYARMLRKQRYDIDSELFRPYLELDKVIAGVFGLATRMYGITFRPAPDIPVYHEDVKAYEVIDKDGSYLAVLYADFHPRKGKQGGAWMTEFQGQWIDRDGVNVRPHVSLVMNLTKPTPDKPALLTMGEVETFLHEFGHALHGIFANTRFESLSGTNVLWDFVELPSQLMENFAAERMFLDGFARHYQTGEALPAAYIRRLRGSRNLFSGYDCLRQVSFALLDMAYYTLERPLPEGTDLEAFEREAWSQAIVLPQPAGALMTPQFSHIMAGGYAAGYYSYKWAEALDADAFSFIFSNGAFRTLHLRKFRDIVLSRGGTREPMSLYKQWRGKEPTIDALLERDGVRFDTADVANEQKVRDLKNGRRRKLREEAKRASHSEE